MATRDVLDAALQGLDQNLQPALDYLAKCEAVNLDWYLWKKIVEEAKYPERVSDNRRPLKYAFNFCRNGAKLTFLQESSDRGVKTPDLKVEIEGFQFYVEVKKFRFG